MRHKFLYLLTGAFSFALIHCTSAEKSDDLDIPLKRKPAHAIDEKEQAENKNLIPPGSKIDWRKFFRAAPNERERTVLARKVASPVDQSSADELLQRARAHLALGQTEAATAHLEAAFRKSPENTEVLLALAKVSLRKEDTHQSFVYLSHLRDVIDGQAESNPTVKFRYRYVLALGHLKRGERTKAHKIFSDLIEIEKTFVPAYAALASSYIELNKLSVAEFIARRGLDRGKDAASLHNILGIIEARKGEHSKARKHYQSALQLSPTYASALVNSANSLLFENQLESAELSLNKAITYEPSNVSAYVSLGICLKKMGRYQDAKSAFEKAIDIQPNNATARFNLGLLLMTKLDQPHVALRLFNEVLMVKDADEKTKSLSRVYIDDIRQSKKD